MDSKDLLWMETDPADSHWEAYYRRGDPDGDRDRHRKDVSEVSRYYEEIGDDLGRHERMAEAMYDV